jgi:hypothetical protein
VSSSTKSPQGIEARTLGVGIHEWTHGDGGDRAWFERYTFDDVDALRKVLVMSALLLGRSMHYFVEAKAAQKVLRLARTLPPARRARSSMGLLLVVVVGLFLLSEK